MAPQIRTVTIEGHTSIQGAQVDLRPLNVLVGANGSGKSNFVRVLELLGRIVDRDLQFYVGLEGGASALLHRPSGTSEMSITVQAEQHTYLVTLMRTADDRLIFSREMTVAPDGGPFSRGNLETHLHDMAATYLVDLLRGCRVFHFHDTSRNAPVKHPHPTADNQMLRADAANLGAVLMRMRQNDEPAYRRIVGAIRQVAPFFRDFVLEPETTDQVRLRWRQVDSDTVFSAHQMSDGTLRFVCLATLLLQSSLPNLIALDEPELGLHPYAIVQLADMLRAAATTSQVVIATQSVTLMDQFSLDDLIVVEREAGASVFSRPDPDRLRDWLEEYSLGELWQKNLIGGRPRREVA